MSDINIVHYSEKAIAVYGNTLSLKSHFEGLQGKFNPSLRSPDENVNEKVKGWIFPKSKLDQVKTIVEKYKNNTLELKSDKPVENIKQTTNDFIVSKEMYLSLISRIEKLEIELNLQNKYIFNHENLKDQTNNLFKDKEIKIQLQQKEKSSLKFKLEKEELYEEEEEDVKPKQRLLSKK